MKAHIYCNNSGHIVSIVELKEDKDVPPTGIFPIPDLKEYVIKLTDEQATMPLIELHIGHRLDLTQKEPRLVSIIPKKRQIKKRTVK